MIFVGVVIEIMFYIIRSYRQSWVLLVSGLLAALYVYLKENVDDWPSFLDGSVEIVVAAASGLLGFILSFNLNMALDKNATGNANFNAFCGDVLAFGMFVCSLTIDEGVDKDKFEKSKKNIRDLLLAAPQICKYTFRGGVKVDLIPVKLKERNSNGDRMSIKLYEKNKAMYCLIKEYQDIGVMESLMLALGNETQNLTAMKAFGPNDAAHMALIGKWENIYSSYGNLGNMFGYQIPVVMDWLLTICLGLYLILMPYGLTAAKYHAVWLSIVVAYFYLGLHIVAGKIGDPFASSTPGAKEEFATVGAAAEATQKAVEALFEKEKRLGLDKLKCDTPMQIIEEESIQNFDDISLPVAPSGMQKLSKERKIEIGINKFKY
tara:strand:+ start:1161 stop:2291 length:1131 start_codon:yes stop_codon:yes gene_type:complete